MMKMKYLRIPATLTGLLILGACATAPSGPSVMVLPGDGKSFDQFRADENDCRAYANQQSSGTAAAANDAGAKTAVISTLIGAAAGAAIDGRSGAGAGAGAGLLMGSLAGTGYASGYGLQRRYDNAFLQCMYSKGHKVPTVSTATRNVNYTNQAPSASAATIPPPPPGLPPPPPAGVSVPR